MFLNRMDRYPQLLAALEEQRGLAVVSRVAGISRARLAALGQGAERMKPTEEWALFGFCEREGLYDMLAEHGVAPPTYNRHGDFDFSLSPVAEYLPIPQQELVTRPTNLLGYTVDFPLGIPACSLTPNHKWLRFYAERGFSILTHKTVRAGPWPGHKAPHWAFVQALEGRLEHPFNEAIVVAGSDAWPSHDSQFSMVNSFGVPSLAPEQWQEEIAKDREVLKPGTVLIVSVMGSPELTDTPDDLVRDFAKAARLAKEAGAQIIEANYSCPNTKGGVEDVYTWPDLSAAISQAIRTAIGPETPFLMKIGYLPSALLERVVKANAHFINGVVAINTIRTQVVNESRAPFFEGRPQAGISGSLIKQKAKEVLENLVLLNARERLELAILGAGGITTVQDVDEFLALGITAALTCTGAWLNPYLAMEARLAQRVSREKLEEVFGKEQVQELDRYIVEPVT